MKNNAHDNRIVKWIFICFTTKDMLRWRDVELNTIYLAVFPKWGKVVFGCTWCDLSWERVVLIPTRLI